MYMYMYIVTICICICICKCMYMYVFNIVCTLTCFCSPTAFGLERTKEGHPAVPTWTQVSQFTSWLMFIGFRIWGFRGLWFRMFRAFIFRMKAWFKAWQCMPIQGVKMHAKSGQVKPECPGWAPAEAAVLVYRPTAATSSKGLWHDALELTLSAQACPANGP